MEKIKNNEKQIKTQKPCPICCEMISEDADICPYCDEPTFFHSEYVNVVNHDEYDESDTSPSSKTSKKKWLIAACVAVVALLGLLIVPLPEDENVDDTSNTSNLYEVADNDDYDAAIDDDYDDGLEDESVEEIDNDSEEFEEYVSSHRKAVINDPDGYTNVRSEPSINSEIVTQKFEGEEFSFEPFNDKWVKVYDDDGNFIGYMAASRVSPIR